MFCLPSSSLTIDIPGARRAKDHVLFISVLPAPGTVCLTCVTWINKCFPKVSEKPSHGFWYLLPPFVSWLARKRMRGNIPKIPRKRRMEEYWGDRHQRMLSVCSWLPSCLLFGLPGGRREEHYVFSILHIWCSGRKCTEMPIRTLKILKSF